MVSTDACESGHASVSRRVPLASVAAAGGWQERWRYKHVVAADGGMNPRARAEAFLEAREQAPDVDRSELFPEVPEEVFGGLWDTEHQTRLYGYEGMHLKEMRGLIAGIKSKLADPETWDMRHIFLTDNLGVVLAQSKGRCQSVCLC